MQIRFDYPGFRTGGQASGLALRWAHVRRRTHGRTPLMAARRRTASRKKSERLREGEDVRERILRGFSERAARSGIRSVIMAELASGLRMSATTLYNHFPAKQDLVRTLVERWAADLGASEVAVAESVSSRSANEGLVRWAEAWATSVARYSPAFWDDLRR